MKNVFLILINGIVFLFALSGCSPSLDVVKVSKEKRVVSLAPSLTEIICAVGAGKHLAGRTSACDYPPEIVGTVPVVGGFGAPSMDVLLRMKPTLVLDVDLKDETLSQVMSRMGLKNERVRCTRLDDIPRAMMKIGRLLDCEQRARLLADELRVGIEKYRRDSAEKDNAGDGRPRVFVEIWGDPLTTVGSKAFISELVALAGGQNIGDTTEKEYFNVSSEWVVKQDPDIIICLYMNRESSLKEAVASRPGWSGTKAVRNRRIYSNLDNNVILRPGPRVLDGAAILRKCIRSEKE